MRKPTNQTVPLEVITAVRVQVCGDLVALLIKDVMENSGGHLEVWNWKAGPQHSCSLPRTHGIDDFSFLTPAVALIVRPTGQFEVYDFLDPAHHSSVPTLRYAFAFPPLSPGYSYWYISMSNNPTPGYIPNPAEHRANMSDFLKGNRQVYHPDPKERVHACCLYVFNPADPVLHAVSSFVFFIKIETLLSPPMHWFQRPIDREGRLPFCHPSVFEGRPEFMEGLWNRDESDDEDVEVHGGEDNMRGRRAGVFVQPGSRSSSSDSLYRSTQDPEEQETLTEIDLPVHGFLTGDADYDELYGPLNGPTPSTSTAGPSSSATTSTATSSITSTTLGAPVQPAETTEATLSSPEYVAVPWEIWGPRNTRWFEECLSTDWQHAIYGLRAVESVEISKMAEERQFNIDDWPVGKDPAEAEQAPTVPVTTTTVIGGVTVTVTTNGQPRRERRFLRVRDFSPYSLNLAEKAAKEAAAPSSSTQPASSSSQAHSPHNFTSHPIFRGKGKCRSVWRTPKVISEPSRVEGAGVFQHDIVSMLPYVETVSDETFDVTDVMMDDERILLLKVSFYPGEVRMVADSMLAEGNAGKTEVIGSAYAVVNIIYEKYRMTVDMYTMCCTFTLRILTLVVITSYKTVRASVMSRSRHKSNERTTTIVSSTIT